MARVPCHSFHCLLSLFSVPAFADTEAELFDLSLRQLMNLPVVGSTLTDETVSTVPSAVTVFDEQFIQSLGVDYLYELLNYVPGYQSHRSADMPLAYGYSVRGRRNGNQAKEVLLLIDGQIVNDPRTGAANGGIRLMSVKPIERIEIIRGPGSAIYGSGAYGGVINVITKQGYQAVGVKAGPRGEVGLNTNLSDHHQTWRWNLNGNFERDDGREFTIENHFTKNDADDELKTKDPFQLAEVNLSVEKDDLKLGLIAYSLEASGMFSIETLSPYFSFNRTNYITGYVEKTFSLFEEVQSDIKLSYSHVDQDLHSQVTGEGDLVAISNPSSSDPLFIKAFVEEEGFRFNIHNDFEANEELSYQFGLSWQRSEILVSKAANNFDAAALGLQQFPIDYYGDFNTSSVAQPQDPLEIMGVYVQSILHFNDHQFNFGLRFDSADTQNSHFSPRLGWVSQVDDNNTFKVLYGEAFRAATLNETANPNSLILKGDPNLEHEVVRTLDIVYLYQQENMNMQVGGYVSEYDKPIDVAVEESGLRRFVNANGDKTAGLEFELNYNLDEKTWVRLSLTEMLDTPNEFFRESETHGSLVINHQDNLWWYNLSAIYAGEKELLSGDELNAIESYILVSGKIQYQIDKSLMASFQLKNIFDQKYYSAPQGNILTDGIPDRGVQATFELNHQFD